VSFHLACLHCLTHARHSVEVVLKMCGLEAFGDAIVGSLGVEHKKRTTIAIELAAKVIDISILRCLKD
jgi:ABC-type multidrug transport system ATPase subunit